METLLIVVEGYVVGSGVLYCVCSTVLLLLDVEVSFVRICYTINQTCVMKTSCDSAILLQCLTVRILE